MCDLMHVGLKYSIEFFSALLRFGIVKSIIVRSLGICSNVLVKKTL